MKRRLLIFAILPVLGIPSTHAATEDFPGKPITIIVPFAAGGSADSLTRIISKGMNKSLRVPIIVENRVGASGQIGATAVARSPGDGYTLLMTTSSVQVIGPLTSPHLT